jgi:hypothetical protein
MNPMGAWWLFAAIFKAARGWDKRLARRRAQFDAFMRKVFTEHPKDS